MCTSTDNLWFGSERCPGADDFTTGEGDPDIDILLTTSVKGDDVAEDTSGDTGDGHESDDVPREGGGCG